MQPHFPFIGDAEHDFDHAGIDPRHEIVEDKNPWLDLIPQGKVAPKTVVDAYRENYRVVWPEVERLIEGISGKAVVTADHGNLVGERTWPIPVKTYGHPNGIRHPNLQTVPWFVFQSGERRDVVADEPSSSQDVRQSDVDKKLEALGYR